MADKKLKNFLSLKHKKIKVIHPPLPPISKNQKLNIKFKNQTIVEDSSSKEEIDIDEGRQENSLCQLTKKVLEYIKSKKKVIININELVKELGVKKRRIYDITNVMEGN